MLFVLLLFDPRGDELFVYTLLDVYDCTALSSFMHACVYPRSSLITLLVLYQSHGPTVSFAPISALEPVLRRVFSGSTIDSL